MQADIETRSDGSRQTRTAPFPSTGDARLDRLLDALRDPARYPHAVGRIELLQTHISCVLLAGDYAYKIKKPVKLGFLDFSTLAARQDYCLAELRLNRRTAPQLYLDVLAICGSDTDPVLGGSGDAIEYALRMRRFDQACLLDNLAQAHLLTPAHVDALAARLVDFHAQAAVAGTDASHGRADQVLAPALENFAQLQPLATTRTERARLSRLHEWTLREHAAQAADFASRRLAGAIRECHGDLHLGNIALLDGVPTAFDCIEFNADLRWIDVMSEIAFLGMDLLYHRAPRLAYRLLNAYLELGGDYGGLGVLRFYLVYRALVRAKVHALRAQQLGRSTPAGTQAQRAGQRHQILAERLSKRPRATLLLMHGLSGSGKSTRAQYLLEFLGAVRLRSDAERKRLFGLGTTARSESAPGAGIYHPDATERTYARLAELARSALGAGFPVIVDATFLARAQRARFAAIAAESGARYLILVCSAAAQDLRSRVSARESKAKSVSEAGLAVLERQFGQIEPLTPEEIAHALHLHADRRALAAEAAVLAARLGL